MVTKEFTLHPFTDIGVSSQLRVTGEISRTTDFLYLRYCVSGNRKLIVWPSREPEQHRCDKLWETTCFECFIQPEGSDRYLEVNLSPNGCWNMYRFYGYRMGMKAEPALQAMSTELYQEDGAIVLRASFPLDGLVVVEESLRTGISCVLEHPDGTKSYWALQHPAGEPDFHHHDSFLLTL